MGGFKKDLQNVGWVFGSKIIVAILNIVGQIILARVLLPEGRGEYTVCIVYSTIISTIFFLGFDVGIRNRLVNNHISLNNSFSYLNGFTIVFSIIAIFFGIILTYVDIEYFNKASQSNLIIGLLIIPFQQVFTQQIILLNTSKKFRIASIYLFITELLKVFLFVLLTIVLKLGVYGALWSIILSYIIGIGMVFFKTQYFKDSSSFNISKTNVYRVLYHGVKYYIGKISNISNVHLSTILIAFFLSKEELGIYSVGSALILKVQMLPDSINSIIIPKMGGKKQSDCANIVFVTMIFNAIVCGILLLLIYFLTDQIVMLLFGKEYLLTSSIIKIISIGIWLRCISKPIEAYYAVISNKPQIASFAVLFGTILNVLGLIYLIPILGIQGAAFASTFNLAGSSLIFLIVFLKKYNIHIFRSRKQIQELSHQLLNILKSNKK